MKVLVLELNDFNSLFQSLNGPGFFACRLTLVGQHAAFCF